ncbi:hypothetical protein ABPG75_000263 [Micractinium tetrahymenae]
MAASQAPHPLAEAICALAAPPMPTTYCLVCDSWLRFFLLLHLRPSATGLEAAAYPGTLLVDRLAQEVWELEVASWQGATVKLLAAEQVTLRAAPAPDRFLFSCPADVGPLAMHVAPNLAEQYYERQHRLRRAAAVAAGLLPAHYAGPC